MHHDSVLTIPIHSYTIVVSFSQCVLRITVEINHNEEVLYMSPKFTQEYFPKELEILFEDPKGLF